MRVILFFVCICLAATAISEASVVEEAASLLDQIATLPLELQRTRSHIPLGVALGQPDAYGIKELETSILEELGQKIRENLEKVLQRLEEIVGEVSQELKELFHLLKGHPTKENAQKLIDQLQDHFQLEGDLGTALSFSLDQKAVAEFTWTAIESRGIVDWWEKIKQWFDGLGTWISDKFDVFKKWAKDVFDKVIDGSKPMMEQIKALAIEFLKNNWETLSTKLVKQALAFFGPFAAQLGEEIWKKFIELAKQKGLPWEQTTPSYLRLN